MTIAQEEAYEAHVALNEASIALRKADMKEAQRHAQLAADLIRTKRGGE